MPTSLHSNALPTNARQSLSRQCARAKEWSRFRANCATVGTIHGTQTGADQPLKGQEE